jgi:hypothetical protein
MCMNYLEQSLTWEADGHAPSQSPFPLWDPSVHYRVYKSHVPFSIQTQVTLVNTFPLYISCNYFNNILFFMPKSYKRPLFLRVSNNALCICILYSCYRPHSSNILAFGRTNTNIWRGIRSTKVFTVQFFSSLLYVPFAVPEVQDVFGEVTEVLILFRWIWDFKVLRGWMSVGKRNTLYCVVSKLVALLWKHRVNLANWLSVDQCSRWLSFASTVMKNHNKLLDECNIIKYMSAYRYIDSTCCGILCHR